MNVVSKVVVSNERGLKWKSLKWMCSHMNRSQINVVSNEVVSNEYVSNERGLKCCGLKWTWSQMNGFKWIGLSSPGTVTNL